MTRRLALAAWLALGGCSHLAGPARVEALTVEGRRFHLQFWPGDEEAARQVRRALASAVPRALRFGRLDAPVLVTIRSDHAALEKAARRAGRPWLRAWARRESIDLQSPRTWEPLGFLLGSPGDDEVAELVAHELTHCATYQAVGDEYTWSLREIPLWFREGLASVAAAQGHRRIGPEAVRRAWREARSGSGEGRPADEDGRGDPLGDPDRLGGEPLSRDDAELVYGTAHHAFSFLVARYGEAPVRGILGRIRRGQEFEEAFQAEIGIPRRAFEADFEHYVVWQGWRRGR